jgi:hypothetical protein
MRIRPFSSHRAPQAREALGVIGSSLRFAHIVCFGPLLAGLASCALSDSPQETSCAAPCDDVDPGGGADMYSPGPLDPAAIVPADPTPDYMTLTAGAVTVDGGSAAVSRIVLYGPTAFPMLIDEGGRVFAAAARSGLGKVLVFGHENYIKGEIKSSDSTKIVRNAIPWMTNKPAPIIGLNSSMTTLAAALQAAGYQTQYVTPSQLGSVSVYITLGYTSLSEADYTSVRQFIANGGGFIVGAQGWSFSGLMMDFPANKMLFGSGLAISNGYAYDISAGLDTVSPTIPSLLLNASTALAKMTAQATGAANLSASDQAIASGSVEIAARDLPLTVKDFYDQTASFLSAVNPAITAATPLVPATNPLGRAATRIRAKFFREQAVSDVTAYPGAADFPGALPQGALRETLNVQINGSYAGRDARYGYSGPSNPVWRSTGAYAAPGEVVTVTVPAAFADKGLAVQIGAHTDTLWDKSSWVRFPAIVRSYPLSAAQISVASAFGGLIYVTVPGGKSLGQVPVTLANVVRAPLYVHDQTTLAEWMTIRDYPAPWAEVGSDKMIVMVPSSYIRTLSDPEELMDRWDQVMDAEADLAAISHTRVRPERFLADRDISAGYMHSGYPIMAPLGEAANLVSHANLTAGNWGFWHEVGHNHQWTPWVIPGTTECSVNWWSVYVSEVLLNVPRAKGHGALLPTDRAQRVQTYIANGRKYANWGNDAWLPLEMYLQLQEWFGWQPFIDLNADYLALTAAASPSNDQARLDQWTLRFAQKVGKNLGPFFVTSWGLPISQSILDQMALLSAWPASSAPRGLEAEPNDTCAQAQTGTPPAGFGILTLPSKPDVDWFVFPATAADVGKVVHAVTEGGDNNTDTVVEVFGGTCAALTSLGGPSPDNNLHEDWLSTPITQPGNVYVKVSYSTDAYNGSKYKLAVTYQ